MLREASREAVRATVAAPWTSLTIIVTLALGTGLNAGMLALVNGILLKPLPYREPSRLVRIEQEIPIDRLDAWASRLATADGVAAFASAPHVLRGMGAPHVVKAAFVSGNFFEVLGSNGSTVGMPTAISSAGGVVVSQRVARAAGVGAQSLLGQPVAVAGLSLPILAVLDGAAGFPEDATAVWIPASAAPEVSLLNRGNDRHFRLLARMKPGVTVAQVAADATAARAALLSLRPGEKAQPVIVHSLEEEQSPGSGPLLSGFLAAAALVLLVACANVSTLLLGRNLVREHEIAVRLALGATRTRLAVGLVGEGVLLSAAASILGIALAAAATRYLRTTEASGLPRLDAVGIDWSVLGAVFLIGLFVAAACTAGPLLLARRTDTTSLVRAHGSSGLHTRRRLTRTLVVAQIAITTVLVLSAGLLARSVVNLLHVDLGIDTRNAVALQLMLTDTMRLAPERTSFVRRCSIAYGRFRASPKPASEAGCRPTGDRYRWASAWCRDPARPGT